MVYYGTGKGLWIMKIYLDLKGAVEEKMNITYFVPLLASRCVIFGLSKGYSFTTETKF